MAEKISASSFKTSNGGQTFVKIVKPKKPAAEAAKSKPWRYGIVLWARAPSAPTEGFTDQWRVIGYVQRDEANYFHAPLEHGESWQQAATRALFEYSSHVLSISPDVLSPHAECYDHPRSTFHVVVQFPAGTSDQDFFDLVKHNTASLNSQKKITLVDLQGRVVWNRGERLADFGPKVINGGAKGAPKFTHHFTEVIKNVYSRVDLCRFVGNKLCLSLEGVFPVIPLQCLASDGIVTLSSSNVVHHQATL